MYRFSIYFCLIALVVTSGAFCSPAPELVRLFCQAQANADSLGRPLAETDRDWEHVFFNLRHRFPISPSELSLGTQPTRIDGCVSVYRDDFDEAEFILKGLAVLDETEQFHRVAAPSDAEDATQISRSTSNILAGLVPRLESKPPHSDAEATIEEGIQNRRARYLKLWSDFTRRLKEKVVRSTIARVNGPSQRPE